jgi:hypothetical protein
MIRAPWSSFRDYVAMRIGGKNDAIMRGYDLTPYGLAPSSIQSALVALNFVGVRTNLSLSELERSLQNELGTSLERTVVVYYLVEWWNWYRIKNGYIRRWPLKRTPGAVQEKALARE